MSIDFPSTLRKGKLPELRQNTKLENELNFRQIKLIDKRGTNKQLRKCNTQQLRDCTRLTIKLETQKTRFKTGDTMGWLPDGYQKFGHQRSTGRAPRNQNPQEGYWETSQKLKIGLNDFYRKDEIRSNVSRRENEKQ